MWGMLQCTGAKGMLWREFHLHLVGPTVVTKVRCVKAKNSPMAHSRACSLRHP